MKKALMVLFSLVVTLINPMVLQANEEADYTGPEEYVFDSKSGVDLKSHVFSPPGEKSEGPLPAMVIFHGGGGPIPAFGQKRDFSRRRGG